MALLFSLIQLASINQTEQEVLSMEKQVADTQNPVASKSNKEAAVTSDSIVDVPVTGSSTKEDKADVTAVSDQNSPGTDVTIGEYGPIVVPSKPATVSKEQENINVQDSNSSKCDEVSTDSLIGEYGPITVANRLAIQAKQNVTESSTSQSDKQNKEKLSKADEGSSIAGDQVRSDACPETAMESNVTEAETLIGEYGSIIIPSKSTAVKMPAKQKDTISAVDEDKTQSKIPSKYPEEPNKGPLVSSDQTLIGEYGPITISSKSTVANMPAEQKDTNIVVDPDNAQSTGHDKGSSEPNDGSVGTENQIISDACPATESNITDVDTLIGEYGPISIPSESTVAKMPVEQKDTKSVADKDKTQSKIPSKDLHEPNKESFVSGDKTLIGEYGPITIPSKSTAANMPVEQKDTKIIVDPDNIQSTDHDKRPSEPNEGSLFTEDQIDQIRSDASPATESNTTDVNTFIGEYGPITISGKSTTANMPVEQKDTKIIVNPDNAQSTDKDKGPVEPNEGSLVTEDQIRSDACPATKSNTTDVDTLIGEYGPISIPSKSTVARMTAEQKDTTSTVEQDTTQSTDHEKGPSKPNGGSLVKVDQIRSDAMSEASPEACITGTDIAIGEYGPIVISSQSSATNMSVEGKDSQDTVDLDKVRSKPVEGSLIRSDLITIPVSESGEYGGMDKEKQQSGLATDSNTTGTSERSDIASENIANTSESIRLDAIAISEQENYGSSVSEVSGTQSAAKPESFSTEIVVGEYGPITMHISDATGVQEEQTESLSSQDHAQDVDARDKVSKKP